MKTLKQFTLTLGAVTLLATVNGWADTSTFVSITSPDHPTTWVAGALQKSKVLRWDATHQRLVVDVKYSTEDYADSVNPAQTDDHTLVFPRVHLAANGTNLVATSRSGGSMVIGHLEDGIFGPEVVLNHGVDLQVHRQQGRIYASLIGDTLARN